MVEFLEKILALSLQQGLVYSQHSLAEERLLDTYIVVCELEKNPHQVKMVKMAQKHGFWTF